MSLLRAPARPQGLRGSERQGRPPVRTADLGERLPPPPARCVPAKLPRCPMSCRPGNKAQLQGQLVLETGPHTLVPWLGPTNTC